MLSKCISMWSKYPPPRPLPALPPPLIILCAYHPQFPFLAPHCSPRVRVQSFSQTLNSLRAEEGVFGQEVQIDSLVIH